MIQCIIPSFSAMLQAETIFNDSFRYLCCSQRRTYPYDYEQFNVNCQKLQHNNDIDIFFLEYAGELRIFVFKEKK